ncbi:MAG: AlkZ family DNA glycosylase [Chloroflexi bacterium]|nr:AlkZ family DNA glycosylase [Chloroflexota bacterium]
MKLTDVATSRLITQQILGTKFTTIKDLVGWMGAMQAQDYPMSKWAVGVRLPGLTERKIEAAIDNAEIIRTHLLRPTWHVVSADDIYWMLELTAPQIKASMKSRHKDLGLSESILTKSNTIIEKTLSGGKSLTRDELMGEIQKAKIPTDENRLSHLLMWAELSGIVGSGTSKAGKQTYALLEERVPKPKAMKKEEALGKLAKRYFTSHGPATLQDFVWWSGLSVGDAKSALEMAKPGLVSETIDSQIYWFDNSFSMTRREKDSVYLLPAYDEIIISYRDRSASLFFEHNNLTISNNGIFRPVIVVNGQVIGLWKRTIKKEKVIVETEFFERPNQITKQLIENAAMQFGNFLEKETEIKQAA